MGINPEGYTVAPEHKEEGNEADGDGDEQGRQVADEVDEPDPVQ
jgi:hypothetical protein